MQSATIVPGEATRDMAASLEYQALGGRRDEAISPEGDIAPEWRHLFGSVYRSGGDRLTEWRRIAARISRERGLAYKAAGVDESPEDGWSIDPIPWIISPDNWTGFEKGIAQRNRLFSALLSDIYGPQKTIRENLFPAEILLNHPGFIRALHNLSPGSGVIGMGLSAFDVAKDSAGQSFVVNDRFDTPFGLGLALENRTVVNQVLPDLFGMCGVRRIGQFFTNWFDHLGKCSPSGSDAPQVVILDGSEKGENSEVGFLANYCGIARVHPSDLTVRDARVWIKALNGLVPVDVIWKMMRGADLDSLESVNRRGRGVSGLFEALRSGGVAVASHPGSEVIQSAGLYPYLPKICRALLGEELLIPPVATWWCGDEIARKHVIANLSSMVVKPAGYHRDFSTRYGSRLSESELSELRDRILADPEKFVGQEELLISTVPTSQPGGMVPRGSVLRMFSFLDREDQTQVMPGGLARVSTAEGVIISTRSSGESKDVWVTSHREEAPFNIASVVRRSHLITPDIVPSRTGENLFWTGRYADRADVISRVAARIVDIRVSGLTGNEEFRLEHEDVLVRSLFDVFDCGKLLSMELGTDARLDLILKDPTCPVGVTYNLERLHAATRATREEWSPASILAIESGYEDWKSNIGSMVTKSAFSSNLQKLQLNLAAFLGLNLDSMTRDEGWVLLDAGRRVERASVVVSLLRCLLKEKLKGDMSTLFNESVLYFLDSVRTYQSRFREIPTTELTMRLLLGEKDYPRSVIHLLSRMDIVLQKLPTPAHHDHPREMLLPWIERLEQFVDQLDEWRIEGGFQREESIRFLDEMLEFLANLSDALTVSYFSHAGENP